MQLKSFGWLNNYALNFSAGITGSLQNQIYNNYEMIHSLFLTTDLQP